MAAVAVLLGLRGIHADEQHAARAVHTTAKVISRGEESVQLLTVDARRITVDQRITRRTTASVRSRPMLEDGSWRRLVAEPYDAIGWQLLGLAATLPGLSLLAVGVPRRRAAALRRAPVPALLVLERTDHEGRTWVYAADDSSARTPPSAASSQRRSRERRRVRKPHRFR
ncbi:hypothetical protein ACRAWF_42700 [Streptomyces sp. L7]